MPKKSNRKKKLEKKADFTKVKLRVGKNKIASSNDTDTSFKSRGIRIRNQIKDNENKETNQKNLTFEDLCIQIKHYNPSVRKDAVLGLSDLFTLYPNQLSDNLGQVLDIFNKLMLDDDEVVRNGALNFLRSHILKISLNSLEPFLGLTVAYICSAMSHIREDIRFDSLDFLQFWTSKAFSFIKQNSEKLAKNFLCLLGNPSQKKGDYSSALSGKKGKSKSRKAIVLGYFTSFIISIYDPLGKTVESKHFDCLLKFPVQDIVRIEFLADKKNDSGNESFKNLVDSTIPLMIDSWLENENELFGPTSEASNFDTLSLVLDVLCVLFRNISDSTLEFFRSHMLQIEKRIGSKFPFGKESQCNNRNEQVKRMNLEYCEIVSQFFGTGCDISDLQSVNDFILSTILSEDINAKNAKHLSIFLKNSLFLSSRWFDPLLQAVVSTSLNPDCQTHMKILAGRFVHSFLINSEDFSSRLESSAPQLETWVSSLPESLSKFESANNIPHYLNEIVILLLKTNGFNQKISLEGLRKLKSMDTCLEPLQREINFYL